MPYEWLLGLESKSGENLKLASVFNADLKKATKKLATDFFTHVNPYTGKSLADDPGVAMFETINECSALMDWGALSAKIPEPYLGELKKLWSDWLKREKLAERPLPPTFKADKDSRRFGLELQTAYLKEMAAHLRSLGIKAPLSGTNITFTAADIEAAVAAKMDYMGEHYYWDHPGVASRPMTYNDRKALATPPWQLPLVATTAQGSLKGYPVVNGEWNFCYPNDYRCEGVPFAAAYAAYQDFGGMLFYCATGSFDGGNWSRFVDNPGILIHSQQTDPSTWGVAQAGAAMYRRGDVATAKRDFEAILPSSAILDQDLQAVRKMPFLCALGRYSFSFSGPEGKANWLGELAQSSASPQELYKKVLEKIGDKRSDMESIVSDTAQLRKHSKQNLLFVDTPKSQSVSGRVCDIAASEDELSALKIASPMTWASISLTSIDGKPVAESKRMLLTAVANATNKTAKVDASAGLINDMGKAPVLAEPVEAKLTLPKAVAGLKVYALDTLTGARREEVKSSRSGDVFAFEIGASAKTIYYELATE
jgi:hypothetical protein